MATVFAIYASNVMLCYVILLFFFKRSPENQNRLCLKRIVAIEGDDITIREDETGSERHITIPKGHCWVEGENAKLSKDSNAYGPVRTVHFFALCFMHAK